MRGLWRRIILAGLAAAIVLGMAVYLRLWIIDYSISADDTESIRRQFDLANKEAMDESAEWRLRYDEKAGIATKCLIELEELKKSFDKKVQYAADMNHQMATLQKDNTALLERVEALNKELEAEKLKCNS